MTKAELLLILDRYDDDADVHLLKPNRHHPDLHKTYTPIGEYRDKYHSNGNCYIEIEKEV